MTLSRNGKPQKQAPTQNVIGDFDEIVDQLRDMLGDLQSRVVKLTDDLQIAAEISTQVATILEPDKLMPQLVESVKERFGLYHAHVYLLDDAGEQLELAAGAGEAGREMLRRGHRIALDAEQSIVAQAARTAEAVIVEDVTAQPIWLPNPLLPYTRSELAVPMLIGSRLIGVLDVQSDEVGRFTDVDRQVKTTLADQLAVTIENARTVEARQAAEQRETLAYEIGQQLNQQQDPTELLQLAVNRLADAFNYYHAHVYTYDANKQTLTVAAGLGEAGQIMTERGHFIEYYAEQSLVATAARELQPVVVQDVRQNPDHLPNPLIPDTVSEVAVPLYIGETLYGVLDVQSDSSNAFDDNELRLLSIIANQLAVALSNAQSLEQTRLRLRDVQIANRAASIISEESDIPNILNQILTMVGSAINADNSAYTELVADGTRWQGIAGYRMTPDFVASIQNEYEEFPHGVDAIENRRVVAVNNAYEYDNFPLEYVDSIGIKSVAAMPVIGQNIPLGVAFFNFNERYHTFTQEEIDLLEGISRQIGSAIESKRLETENSRQRQDAERRAQELETVAIIATQAANTLDLSELLSDVVELTKARFDLYHAHIYLLDEQGHRLDLAAGAGEPGRQMLERRHAISLNHPDSIVATAARENTGVIANNVADAPDFLPNPLLPETRSEMAIPLEVNQQVIGVFDIQSNQSNRFDEDDLTLQLVLAGQIAVAVSNARRFEEAQQLTKENAIIAQVSEALSTAQDEQGIIAALDPLRDLVPHTFTTLAYPEEGGNVLHTVAARAGGQLVPLEMLPTTRVTDDEFPILQRHRTNKNQVLVIENSETDESLSQAERDVLQQTGLAAVVTLTPTAGDSWLASLTIGFNEPQSFDERIRAIFERLRPTITTVVISRLSFLAEQQSSQERERRARELETVAQVGVATNTILDTDQLLLSVVELTKSAFELYHAHIYLYAPEANQLVLAAGAGEPGQMMKKHGHSININNPTSIVARAARERDGVVINDVFQAETFMPNPLLPQTRAEMAIPMLVADRLIGVLDVQSSEPDRFTDDDIRVKSTLASQVAVAVENARAFQRAEEVAQREREAADSLREVDRLKSEFLASMSHELRTPLNSIIGYSEVMLDGGDGDLPDEAVEDIDIIYTSGRHLLNIINDILDLAKIEANQMKLNRKPTELVKLLEEVIKSNQILVKDRDLDLRLETEVDELVIPIDELRIRQVMLNLFSNAVKFTDEGSVTISLTMLDDVTAKVAVIDTGIGIPQSEQAIVFDQFRQVDGSSTRKAGGTGLGLPITRYLVNMHGGEIQLESEEGVGSTFWFTLPLIEPDEEEIKAKLQDIQPVQ